MKATAFLSDARADSSFGKKLAADLKAAGCPVWIDQLDIVPGTRWDTAIEKALSDALVLIVVLRPASVASDNVQDEVGYAVEEGKPVVPVLHLPCKVPLRLRRLHRVDCVSDYQAGLTELVKLLKALPSPARVGSDSHAAPAAATRRRSSNVAAEQPRRVSDVDQNKVAAPPRASSVSRPPIAAPSPDGAATDWRTRYAERNRLTNERKAAARLVRPAFYRTIAWWASIGFAAVYAVGGALIADALAPWVVSTSLPVSWASADKIAAMRVPAAATMLAGLAWAVVYCVSGTRSYIDDRTRAAARSLSKACSTDGPRRPPISRPSRSSRGPRR